MNPPLYCKRLAILVADGFDASSVAPLRQLLARDGVIIDLVAHIGGPVRADTVEWTGKAAFARQFDAQQIVAYHALVIPSGPAAAQFLKAHGGTRRFIASFASQRKPIAAIGDGVSLLIGLGLLDGRIVAAQASLRGDVVDDGAIWINEDVTTDDWLVTARSSADSMAFTQAVRAVFTRSDLSLVG